MREPLEEGQEHAAAGSVLGLDNIALELPVAGLGSRVLAAGLDYLLVMVLLALSMVLVAVLLLAVFEVSPLWVLVALTLLLFLGHWGYFIGFELATGGRTPGKRAVHLRVVGREGGTPPPTGIVLRNLLRDIDLVAAVPLIVTDPLARRLGDRVGGTLVIHDRAPELEVTLGRIPAGWGGREVALAESFLRRSEELAPGRRHYLARRLLELVARDDPALLAASGGGNDPESVLRRALEAREREPRS